MRVWTITVGEPLPTDGANPRLYRTGMLAHELASRGHDVSWWCSTFDHSTKRQRAAASADVSVTPRLTLKWLRTPGYRRNVSLARLYDHFVAGRAFAARAPLEPRPDVILCSLPTLDLARAATRFGRAHGIPVVLDVRDWWPDEFEREFPPVLRPLASMAVTPYRRMARAACQAATAIAGITDAFVGWGVEKAGRARGLLDKTFHMGYSAAEPPAAALEAAERFWRDQGLTNDRSQLTILYSGNFSSRVELDLVLEAVRDLRAAGRAVRLVLCGTGSTYETLRRAAEGMDGVVMPGRVDRPALWAALRMSDIGIVPYLPTESFLGTLSNKMAEYWAGGLPIVLSLPQGVAYDLMHEHGCGVAYRYGDRASLVTLLSELESDRARLRGMQANARRLYETQFVAETIYAQMAAYLEDLAARGVRQEDIL